MTASRGWAETSSFCCRSVASQPEAAAQLADRLIKKLAEPFELAGNQAYIGVSIGIAVAPPDC